MVNVGFLLWISSYDNYVYFHYKSFGVLFGCCPYHLRSIKKIGSLAYVRRCVNECGPFGLCLKMCRCIWPIWPKFRDVSISVACLANVQRHVDSCGLFGLCLETCRWEWLVWPTSRYVWIALVNTLLQRKARTCIDVCVTTLLYWIKEMSCMDNIKSNLSLTEVREAWSFAWSWADR